MLEEWNHEKNELIKLIKNYSAIGYRKGAGGEDIPEIADKTKEELFIIIKEIIELDSNIISKKVEDYDKLHKQILKIHHDIKKAMKC